MLIKPDRQRYPRIDPAENADLRRGHSIIRFTSSMLSPGLTSPDGSGIPFG